MEKEYNGGWDTFYLFQTSRSEHKAKVIIDEFKDYFTTKVALEWQWKYF